MRDLPKLEQDLKDTRQEVRNLCVLSMRPNLLPAEISLLKNLERSARAEVRLLLKAIQHLKAKA